MRSTPDSTKCAANAERLFAMLEDISRMPSMVQNGVTWVAMPGYLLENARALIAECTKDTQSLHGGEWV